MRSSVRIHAVLLGAALIAAYFVWTREPSPEKEDEITIASLGDLDKVIYEEPDRTVEITRRKDDKGDYFWVKVDKKERPPRKFTPPPRPPRPPAKGKAPPTKLGPAAKSLRGKIAPPTRRPPGKLGARPKPWPSKTKVAPKKGGPARAKPPTKSSLTRDPKAPPTKAPAAKAPAAKAPAAKAAVKKPAPKKAPPAKEPATAEKKPSVNKPAKPGLPSLLTKAAPASQPVSKAKPPEPPKVRKVEEFKGNDAAADLVKRLGKFSAFRSLGQPDGKKLETFGLAESKKSLILVSGSTRRVFVIGNKTHGNSDRYILDKQDKRVYVVRPRAMQDLQYAEYRLLDRNLLDFDASDIDRAEISAKAGSKTLVQHNRRESRNAFWNKEGGEKKRNELYQTWMTKLLRLRAVKYAGDIGKVDDLEQIFAVELSLGSKKKGWLKVLKGKSSPVALSGDKAVKQTTEFYAITDNTRTHVELPRSRADELARDIDSIIKD